MSKSQIKTTPEADDFNILQPLFKKYPPNEILSNKYAPDAVPQVRLM